MTLAYMSFISIGTFYCNQYFCVLIFTANTCSKYFHRASKRGRSGLVFLGVRTVLVLSGVSCGNRLCSLRVSSSILLRKSSIIFLLSVPIPSHKRKISQSSYRAIRMSAVLALSSTVLVLLSLRSATES